MDEALGTNSMNDEMESPGVESPVISSLKAFLSISKTDLFHVVVILDLQSLEGLVVVVLNLDILVSQ